LSLNNAVYLVSLFRAGGPDDLFYVVPHAAHTSSLSPTAEFDRRILDQLYTDKVIAVHPGSGHEIPFSSKTARSRNSFRSRFTGFCQRRQVVPRPQDIEDLERLLKSEDEWPDDWHEDVAELNRVVALEECLQYLRISLEEHGFEARPSEKLTLVLRSVLARFSLGQTYNFIWRAARDAAAIYLRENTSKAHAVNIVPGHIQRGAERALAEGWAVKAFRRDRRIPESQVTHVLLTMALKLTDGGFGSVPPAPPEPPGESTSGDDES
jgi:hypothetical protein